jgi:hypothetical protein
MERQQRWVIMNDDMTLCWSNTDGWVEGPGFDVFTSAELKSIRLPMGGFLFLHDEEDK